jgi:hypothetical protein
VLHAAATAVVAGCCCNLWCCCWIVAVHLLHPAMLPEVSGAAHQ